ncbi:MAG: hypothetical protein COZ08_13165 [Bacteroidetes bacterium CG_4_10_14_3_um_filter_42_6]|nr:MAG: hypothetical protein COZ08_13165 [Bacteroidetes bacterium CG_4_10_14_3_um_filter_42_6]
MDSERLLCYKNDRRIGRFYGQKRDIAVKGKKRLLKAFWYVRGLPPTKNSEKRLFVGYRGPGGHNQGLGNPPRSGSGGDHHGANQ